MAMADVDDKPGIEEKYLAATNTSSLKIDLVRRTQADVILAAGLSAGGNQLGQALIHLRGEWDRCEKPRKRSPAEISARAAVLKDKKGRPDVRRAAIEAMVWHASAMRERAAKLAGRSAVIGLLTLWAEERGIDRDLLSPALYHWLAPKCPACDGHGNPKIPDTPSLSAKRCQHCFHRLKHFFGKRWIRLVHTTCHGDRADQSRRDRERPFPRRRLDSAWPLRALNRFCNFFEPLSKRSADAAVLASDLACGGCHRAHMCWIVPRRGRQVVV